MAILEGPLAVAYESFIAYHAGVAASNVSRTTRLSRKQKYLVLEEEMATQRRSFANSILTATAAADLLRDRVYYQPNRGWLILNDRMTWGSGKWHHLESALNRWTPYDLRDGVYFPHYGASSATRQILMAYLVGPVCPSPITGKKVISNDGRPYSREFGRSLGLLEENQAPLAAVLPLRDFPSAELDDWARIIGCAEARWTLRCFFETPREELAYLATSTHLFPSAEVELGVLDAFVSFLRVAHPGSESRRVDAQKFLRYVDRFRDRLRRCYSPGAPFYDVDGTLIAGAL